VVDKSTNDKILTVQSKINNNIVMLFKKIDKRLDMLEKEVKELKKNDYPTEEELQSIKWGGTD